MFEYINQRSRVLAIILVLIMAVFVIRLFQLQILQHEHYKSIARSEQTKQWVLPAQRGEIYAMDNGAPRKIVLNQAVYKMWADPSVIEDPNDIYVTLQEYAGGNLVDNAKALMSKKESRYQVIARDLTYKQATSIKSKKLYGIGFERSDKRVYPDGKLASQVIGFVNDDGDGQYGVEGYLNQELKGQDGLLKTITDVRDVPLTIGDENISQPAKHGKNIALSIDENVQAAAERILPEQMKKIGATKGSLLVMNPNNGQVLAMANTPTYDLSRRSDVNDISLFNNPIISEPYEPASVIKTLTMSAGVDQGVMSPESTFINTGSTRVQDRTINNASKNAVISGKVTMQTALNWSLNTGTVEMARWLGGGSVNRKARDILYNYYHDKFRLGLPTNIQLQGESSGIVVPPTDPQGNEVRYATMTFGQGLNVTTLQVASAFCAVVNGGIYYTPTVVAGTVNDAGVFESRTEQNPEQVIKQSTSDTMREMIHVARQQFGYNSSDPKGFYIGGKTGTAQTVANGEYTFDQQTGTYVGFGGTPGEKPAYVVMAYVAKPNVVLSGQEAMIVFNEMSNWMINYLKLEPKG